MKKQLKGFTHYPIIEAENATFGFLNEAGQVEAEGFTTEIEAAYKLGRYCAILDLPNLSGKDFDLLRKVEGLQKQNGELIEQLGKANKDKVLIDKVKKLCDSARDASTTLYNIGQRQKEFSSQIYPKVRDLDNSINDVKKLLNKG